MPTIESGGLYEGQTLDATNPSADVPQLPKAICCLSQPQCDTARQGLGCEHAMSRVELVEWLEKLRSHRVSIESGAGRVKAATKAKTSKPKLDEEW